MNRSYKEKLPNTISYEHQSIISNLKSAIEKNMISYMDSDVNKLFQFCKKHPEFLPTETLEEFQERCNSFLHIIWQSPNPKDEIKRLLIPKLPQPKK